MEGKKLSKGTVFENHRKSLILHCERSELRLHYEWTKVNQKCRKWSILASGQTVLPDRNWWKMPKLEKWLATFLNNFQTMCILIIKSKVWKDKGGGEEASESRGKIWWWLKGSSFIGWWSIWKMEAKVVEVGGKIISSVYIDEKSKSPEKLSSICYMSQCWHAQFMKTMSIS